MHSMDSEKVLKMYSIVEREAIDRYNYKRAYSNKNTIKDKAEVAERILASLAREASGQ